MTMLTMTRGDTRAFDLEVTFNGNPVTIDETVGLRFTAKRRYSDPDDYAVIAKELGSGLEAGEAGHVTLTIAPGDTVDLERRVLVWDVELTDPEENVYTVASGTLHVDPDVSRTVVGS